MVNRTCVRGVNHRLVEDIFIQRKQKLNSTINIHFSTNSEGIRLLPNLFNRSGIFSLIKCFGLESNRSLKHFYRLRLKRKDIKVIILGTGNVLKKKSEY